MLRPAGCLSGVAQAEGVGDREDDTKVAMVVPLGQTAGWPI